MTASTTGTALSASQVSALESIVGREGIVASPTELVSYECDAYTLERELPQAVVLPTTTGQVSEVLRYCGREGLPVIPRGAGTSLSGTVLPLGGGVLVTMSRMTRVLEINVRDRRALVEAGCVNAWITNAVRRHGLHYAPDPSSQGACTLGGNIATNSGGPHTLKYGVTTHHVLGLELVLPDGSVQWMGPGMEDGDEVEGLDLRGVVVGAEGMFGVVTRALVKLSVAPAAFKTLLGVFESVDDASRTVSDIIQSGMVPAAVEMMDRLITQAVEKAYRFGFPTDAGAVLIVELDGHPEGLERQAAKIVELSRRNGAREVRTARDAAERLEVWKCRKRAFGAIGRLSSSYITQDGVVPRSRLPEMMRYIGETADRYGLRIPNVFHAGDGNLHPLILFDERDPNQVGRAVAAGEAILGRCIDLGGSVSGEHGIGIEKVDFMARQFTESDLEAMRRVRRAFDPGERCNPHKMFPGSKRCGDVFVRRGAAV